MMEMPKPTDAHRLLERLAGKWTGTEKMYPSQWDPKGGTAIARTQSRAALSGFALICDYQQERDGVVTFEGHGVYTYDPREQQYVLHWFDCMGMPPDVFRGKLAGNTLTLIAVNPMGHWRITYDLSEPGRMRSRMEMSHDGTNWKPLFDGSYTREG